MKLYRFFYADTSDNPSYPRGRIWSFMATCFAEITRPELVEYMEENDRRLSILHRDHIMGVEYIPYTSTVAGVEERRFMIFLLLDCPVARTMWRLEVNYSAPGPYEPEFESCSIAS